ncbi:MAG: hypothetical protein DRR16_30545, partial [Candidatus Parabeggiatoa sp. nov. 3]
HEPKGSYAKYTLRRGKPLWLPFLYLTQTKNAILGRRRKHCVSTKSKNDIRQETQALRLYKIKK